MTTTKCFRCRQMVPKGNFCSSCGVKLVEDDEQCDCWVLGRKSNCGQSECPGTMNYKEFLEYKGYMK